MSVIENLTHLTHNYGKRKPQAVIIHYTGCSEEVALHQLTAKEAMPPVSAHYLIRDDGTITQLVKEEDRAWHAGKSYWRGFEDINSLSIGIEISHWGYLGDHVPEHEAQKLFPETVHVKGSPHRWIPYRKEQIQSVIKLCQDIQVRWQIPSHLFLGHSDIAPGRKVDPGPLFPWKEMALNHQIGTYPTPSAINLETEKSLLWTQEKLRAWGYDCPLSGEQDAETTEILQAFQLHYRPSNVTGLADLETQKTLASLFSKPV